METDLRALIVYESMFGNSRQVAEAIAVGLSEHLRVEIRDVTSEPAPDLTGRTLIVAGGPTHAFSLSRPTTRADAITQGATCGSKQTGLREWLGQLAPAAVDQSFATYDTRVEVIRHMPGSASRKAARMARALGFRSLGRESFRVAGTFGPLLPGELSRARAWGTTLGVRVLAKQTAGAGHAEA